MRSNSNYSSKVKVILVVLLFLCLLDMPYGFYQFVRFVAMVGFGWLAYLSHNAGEKQLSLIYLALLVLFQPLIKIPLGRSLWNIVDVVVGIWLVLDILGLRLKFEKK